MAHRMKLCIHCKYFRTQATGRHDSPRCEHPNNTEISLVTGEPIYGHTPTTLRFASHKCGKKAKWFEPLQEQEAA